MATINTAVAMILNFFKKLSTMVFDLKLKILLGIAVLKFFKIIFYCGDIFFKKKLKTYSFGNDMAIILIYVLIWENCFQKKLFWDVNL